MTAQPHDSSNKLLFSHRAMGEDLLTGFVHEDWVAELDFTTLEKVSGSYVSDDLRPGADNVVWRVRWRGRWPYVYLLLEFKSEVDPWMAVRLLVYVGLLYQDLIRAGQGAADGRLPPVLPLAPYIRCGQRLERGAQYVGGTGDGMGGGMEAAGLAAGLAAGFGRRAALAATAGATPLRRNGCGGQRAVAGAGGEAGGVEGLGRRRC